MRLWTLHPQYLDTPGLVALWREALLARAVIRGHTRGYRAHPQLRRFRESASPRSAVNAYLAVVHHEAVTRGYAFDRSKLAPVRVELEVLCTAGQLHYEWQWLLAKLRARNPGLHRRFSRIATPDAHPLFRIVAGPVCDWERIAASPHAR